MNNILYLTCGYPSMEKTYHNIKTNQEAKTIILSLPFSDPIAENPSLQKQNNLALANGFTLNRFFEFLEEINKVNRVPIIIRAYANVVYSFGAQYFINMLSQHSVVGLLIPDLPYEEKEEFQSICDKHNIDLLSIVSTNNIHRIKTILNDTKGMIYVYSRPDDNLDACLNEIKKYSSNPYILDQTISYL